MFEFLFTYFDEELLDFFVGCLWDEFFSGVSTYIDGCLRVWNSDLFGNFKSRSGCFEMFDDFNAY
jgi:hypothetical protein